MLTRCPSCEKAVVVPQSGVQTCPRCGARVWFADPQSGQEDRVLIDPQEQADIIRQRAEARLPPSVRELFLAAPKSRLAPFEDPQSPNQLNGLWRTFIQSLLFPGPFFFSLAHRAPLYPALFYGWVFNTLGYVFMCAWQIYLLPELVLSGKEGLTVATYADLMRQTEWAWYMLCGAPVLALFTLFFSAGLYHLFLRLMNGREKTPPFRATLRGVSYASSPLILMGIPIIGIFMAKFWSIMTTVVALARIHETHTLRAVAAYIFPTLFALAVVLLTSRFLDEELAQSMMEMLK